MNKRRISHKEIRLVIIMQAAGVINSQLVKIGDRCVYKVNCFESVE